MLKPKARRALHCENRCRPGPEEWAEFGKVLHISDQIFGVDAVDCGATKRTSVRPHGWLKSCRQSTWPGDLAAANDSALVELEAAGDQAQQRRFARAVAASRPTLLPAFSVSDTSSMMRLLDALVAAYFVACSNRIIRSQRLLERVKTSIPANNVRNAIP